MGSFDFTNITGCEIIRKVSKDKDGVKIDDECDKGCLWDKGGFIFRYSLMILENCNFLEDYHIDLGEYLRSDGDEDGWNLIYYCLIESFLI